MPPDVQPKKFLKSLLLYGPCCCNCVHGMYCYSVEMLASPRYIPVGSGCADCHRSDNFQNYKPLYEIAKE